MCNFQILNIIDSLGVKANPNYLGLARVTDSFIEIKERVRRIITFISLIQEARGVKICSHIADAMRLDVTFSDLNYLC